MAKKSNKDIKRFKCMNFGACSKADSGEIIEIDSLETLGGIPACPHCHQHTLEEQIKKSVNKSLIIGIIAAIVIIGGILAAIFAGGGKHEPEVTTDIAVVDSDSIRAAQLAEQESVERQRVQDSLQAVADSLARIAEEERLAEEKTRNNAQKPVAPRASSGSKDLGYATFKGTWPNDVKGRLVFKSSHVIDSRDPKGRMAEPGDYIIGEFADGHLVHGIWYGSDNVVKGSVIIGK